MNIDYMSLERIKNFVRQKFGKEIKKEIKNDIPIPENIKLTPSGDIIFNNRRQALGINDTGDYYVLCHSYWRNYNNEFKLVPVNYEDIEEGDTITIQQEKDKLQWWFKVGGDKVFWHISDNMEVWKEKCSKCYKYILLKVVRR